MKDIYTGELKAAQRRQKAQGKKSQVVDYEKHIKEVENTTGEEEIPPKKFDDDMYI